MPVEPIGSSSVSRYFARRGDANALAHAPQDVNGDKIVSGAKLEPHRIKDAHYGDHFVVFQGKEEDVYVSKTSMYNELVPMMFRISHGIDHRNRPAELNKQIFGMITMFRKGKNSQVHEYLQKNAFTYNNVNRLKHIIRNPEKYNDPVHKVDMTRILRYMKGYRGELDPNPTKRRWKAVVYRPLIMLRAFFRTARNADEIGSKGTRTLSINVPSAMVVSIAVAAGSLGFVGYSVQKNKQNESTSLQA